MPRDDWQAPDADTLGKALVLAEDRTTSSQEGVVVCARIYRDELGFDVMFAASYAKLREQGIASMWAPVLTMLPNLQIEVYPVLEGFVPPGRKA